MENKANSVVVLILSWTLVCLISCSDQQLRSSTSNNNSRPRSNSNAPSRAENRDSRDVRTQKLSGVVVSITDGDTITILDKTNASKVIRLKGIDAPERMQDFSNVSRRHLGDLIAEKQVDVEYDKIERGRIIGKVMMNGQDICLEQIKAGLAWHYKYFENEQTPSERAEYAAAEVTARSAKRGLWQYESATPPWEFRRSGRTNQSSVDSASQPGPLVALSNGRIIGNRSSMIYHWPGCPNYYDVSPRNRVYFDSREDAERAGFRAARNCN